MIDNNVPLEDIEAELLSKYLTLKKYKFTHIGNESGQRGTANIIAMMKKKKKMGVSTGVPDFMIILKRGSLLFIELKRRKKGLSKVSEDQKQWIEKLNEIDNVGASIAYGAEHAIQIVKYHEEF